MTEQEIREQLKTILCRHKTKTINCEGIRYNTEYMQFISKIQHSTFKDNQRAAIYAIVHDIYEWPKCVVCGKDVVFTNGVFKKCCCRSCAQKAVDNEQKKKKRIETCMNKYGAPHNWASKELREHGKQTCLQKYGYTSYSQTSAFKEQVKQTSLERYGVENILSKPSIRDQIKQTCLKKYGVEYYPQDDTSKIKRKQTMQERYGVDTPFALQSAIQKQQEFRTNESYNQIIKFNTECKPLFTYEEFAKNGPFHMYLWECKKCGHIFEHTARTANNGYHTIRCEKCSPNSQIQKQLQDFVLSISPDAKFNTRNIISPKELDIYIPSKNIAIEFNGVFYHNDYHVESDYHLNKLNSCRDKHIHLIHIWDCDYVNHPQIIQDRLKSMFGVYDKKIYARKCIVKEITAKCGKAFISQYHLQGSDSSKIYLGLFYDEELISVMSFSKPRFTKQYEYELVRFVNKSNYHVIGGAGKLLSYFEKTFNPHSLVTYADKCWSDGNLYNQLKFNHIYDTPPGYFYCKNNVKYSRYMCQKHKLAKLLGDKFNPTLSESDNMKNNQFSKVYDCGNMVFVKNYE